MYEVNHTYYTSLVFWSGWQQGACSSPVLLLGHFAVLVCTPAKTKQIKRDCSPAFQVRIFTILIKKRKMSSFEDIFLFWSGWQDSNLRPLRPERNALPSWATSRNAKYVTTKSNFCLLHCYQSPKLHLRFYLYRF